MDDTAAWVLKSRRLEEEAKKKQIAEAAKKAAQLNAMDEEAEAEDSDDEAVQKKRSACQPPHLTLDMLARSSVSAKPFLDEQSLPLLPAALAFCVLWGGAGIKLRGSRLHTAWTSLRSARSRS